MAARSRIDFAGVLAWLVVAVIFVAIAAGVFSIRLAITGGDVGCTFSQDPALCVAVKEGVR